MAVQVTAITIVIVGLQGLTALLTAKWLGASDRGVIAVAQTLSMVLTLVGTGGLITGSRVLLADPSRRISLSAYIVAIRWLMAIQAVAIGTLGLAIFLRLTSEKFGWTAVLFIFLCFGSLRAALLREAFHGVGWHREAMVSELVSAGLALVLMCVAFARHSLNLDVAFACLTIGYVAQLILQTALIRQYNRLHGSPDLGGQRSWVLLGSMLKFSVPSLIGSIAFAFVGRMDRLILAFFHGPAAVGVYATASTLADLSWSVPMASSALIIRQVARSGSVECHRTWYFRLMVGTIVLSLVVFGGSVLLFNRFLDESFRGGVLVTAILLVGSLAKTSEQVDLAVCAGMGDLKATAHTALVGCAFAIPFFFVLIPPFGGIGCAVGSTLAYFVFAIVARVQLNKHRNIPAVSD